MRQPTSLPARVEDWPLVLAGGTAESAALICGVRNCGHDFLDDPGGWNRMPTDVDTATLGQLTAAILAHRPQCPVRS